MTAEVWSVRTDLMKRTVCTRCDHMHRRVVRDLCACCRADIRGEDPAPEEAAS